MSVRTNVATTGLSTELFSFCAELNRASVHEANYWWHDNYQGRYVFKLMITLFSVVFFSSVIISFVQLWTCTCHAHLALSLVYEMDMRFMNRNRSCNFKCVFDSYITSCRNSVVHFVRQHGSTTVIVKIVLILENFQNLVKCDILTYRWFICDWEVHIILYHSTLEVMWIHW